MDLEEIKAILESLIFTAEKPLPLSEAVRIVQEVKAEEVDPSLRDLVSQGMQQLMEDYSSLHPLRGLELAEVAGGFQFRTIPAHAPYVSKLFEERPRGLSRAAMETLAIIAYRQPVTRPEIEEVRGVDSSGVLKLLLERQLIRVRGRRDEPGRPLLYGTTPEFLEFFGLKDLGELPSLEEFQSLMEEEAPPVEKAAVEPLPLAAVPAGTPDPESEQVLASLDDAMKRTKRASRAAARTLAEREAEVLEAETTPPDEGDE